MAKLVTLLSAVGATGAGTANDTTQDKMTFHCEGITTATVDVQVSNDGTNYIDSGLSFTADGVGAVDGPFKQVRGNVSAHTTGTITLTALV